MTKDGRSAHPISSFAEQVIYGFGWSGNHDELAINYLEGVSLRIGSLKVHTGKFDAVASASSGVNLYMSASRSGSVAWVHNDGATAASLVVERPRAPGAQTIVDLNPQVKAWSLGTQEIVRWQNIRGTQRIGVLIKPQGYERSKKYPLIVDVYPQQLDGFKGDAMAGNQAWASRGYAVFYPNPRAPHFSGFANRVDRLTSVGPSAWDLTVDDIVSGVEELGHRGIIDPERIALYGFSNGGGVANYVISQTSLFRCAVSVAGVNADWATDVFLNTGSPVPGMAGGLTPWANPDDYVKLSAVYYVDKVEAPVLLAVGDDDGHNTLLGAIEMFNGLRQNGANVTLLRYPKQGHGFSDPALSDFWGRESEFFDTCLKARP
jgi:dipeptidyl aminopeptidase/acylaminoacyl peptidase